MRMLKTDILVSDVIEIAKINKLDGFLVAMDIEKAFCTTNEVGRFTINYTKRIAKEKRQQRRNLENQLKILEKCLDKDDNLSK